MRARSAALVAAVLASAGLLLGAIPAASAPDPVAQARERASTATAAREEAEARLAAASARRAELERRTSELADADATATANLAEAHRQVRELAVAAYIDGGRTQVMQAGLEPEEAAAVSWRVGMVTAGAGQVSESVERYQQLQEQNDPEQQEVALELDRTRSAEEQARSDVVQTSAAERDALAAAEAATAARARAAAEAASARRQQAARQQSAEQASAQPARRTASASARSSSAAGLGVSSSGGGPTAEESAFLAKVRQCESGGNYSIVSSTGRYRGAYQFSVQTWRGVGGTGDPAAASPAEQDARALALLRLQGKRAWPVCSKR